MKKKRNANTEGGAVPRRTFLKTSAALASVGMAADVFVKDASPAPLDTPTGQNPVDSVESAEDLIYTVCQMCHSRCGVRAKVQDGILVKLDGSPYHPNNRDVNEDNVPDRLPYDTPPESAVQSLGRMCLKGQSGIQTLYDPYRIQHPLKRVGARNSGQWETITWDQAFAEIAVRINTLIPPTERDRLIDPSRPELGTKRNQLVYAPGRSVEKELSERVWKLGWGTVNYGLDHTSICEATRHVASELITWDPKGSATSLGGGRSSGWQADILGSEYIIFFGANPLEADFPMVGMARNLMQFKANGGKYVTVDPRLNNTGVLANQWVPIIPGTDAALAMAMISWIIENATYDHRYLENTSQAAATLDKEPTWSDATYLVGTFSDAGQTYQRYLTARDLNPADTEDYLVYADGGVRKYTDFEHGDLDAITSVTVGGQSITAKSSFRLLKEAALSKTRAEYSTICGVPLATIEALAKEFVSHGKKAVALSYRGPVKHTNGLYNQLAIQHLNTLIGNYDWKGGCTAGAGGWSHKSGAVDLNNIDPTLKPPKASGVRLDRAKTFYNPTEVMSLFTGYPARRPWFPFALYGNYQEVVPSIQDGYPYPIKVLITYWNAWPYSTPALKRVWEQTMADENKVPLYVAITPVIGEASAFADIILPDTVYLEKFSFPGVPWRVNKGTSFQRPVVGKFDGKPIGVSPSNGGVGNTIPFDAQNDYTPVLGDTKPALEIHLGLARALGLPGVGNDSLLTTSGARLDLNNGWDWVRAMLLNLAQNSGRPVEEIIAKGGVFDNPGDEYDEAGLRYRYGNIIRTFADPVARTRDSVTGRYYSGVAHYEAPKHSNGAAISDSGFTFRLITYKLVNHGQARTNINPWLMLIQPENFVDISAADARPLGIETGDPVRISSASNTTGITGKARVTQGLRPGVIAVSHHYGHWEQHSKPVQVRTNGIWSQMGFDPSRGAGIQPTQIMRADARYPNVSLQEPIGASCSFYDTWVRIQKV